MATSPLTKNRNKTLRAWVVARTPGKTPPNPKVKAASAPAPQVKTVSAPVEVSTGTPWTNENVVVWEPTKEARPGSAEYNDIYEQLAKVCKETGIGEVEYNPAPTPIEAKTSPAPKDDRGIVNFLTQQPRYDESRVWLWRDVYVDIANGWVESKGINIPPLVLTDQLKTVPFHYPIPGCTVTGHEFGKVLVKIQSDQSGLKVDLMYLAEKQAKYVKKYGGYPMNFKKFAEFLSTVRSAERASTL